MTTSEIYNYVKPIVESFYNRSYQEIVMDTKALIGEGQDPVAVQKSENQRMREVRLDIEAGIKIALVVEIFVKSNYTLSDVQIAQIIDEARKVNEQIPSLARSSVGRYLTDKRIAKLYSDDIYKLILEKRKENLMLAKSKGGKAFVQNNVSIKDDLGHFRGSVRR